jgi:hypothetical protein
MNKTLNVNFYVVAFLLAFFSLYVHTIAFSQNIESQQKAAAEAILNEINNAKPKREGQTQREASIEAAQEIVKKNMDKAKSNDAKFDAAVNIFRGYFLINAISRPAYCKMHNVSIDIFAREFMNTYRYEFEVMRQHEIKNSLSKNESKQLDEMLAKQVATEMETVAKQFNISVKDYCRDIRDNFQQHVKLVDLKTRAPAVYQQLNK